jgi:hypothetical protein
MVQNLLAIADQSPDQPATELELDAIMQEQQEILSHDNNDTIDNSNNNNIHDNTPPIPALTIGTIQDNVVAANTFRSYLGSIAHLLKWIVVEQSSWLTLHRTWLVQQLQTSNEGAAEACTPACHR